MKRIVYSPKVNVVIKTETDIYDISEYLVSGSVNRKLDEVSSLEVQFRNPDNMFTNGPDGPIFNPMDPVVAFMTRIENKPIQVFTGYLDSAPYFALRPGVVGLTASCTLKRLLYKYFDPGLPFFWKFLSQQGWMANTNLGAVWDPSANQDNGNDDAADDDDPENSEFPDPMTGDLNDANFGNTLYKVLTDIGGWDGDDVYIENLPPKIIDMVEGLYYQVSEADPDGRNMFRETLKKMIQTNLVGSSGSVGDVDGGPTEGNLGGVRGTGFTADEVKTVRDHPEAGSTVAEGTYVSTAYGPPWNALEGSGITSTGVTLGDQAPFKPRYLLAVDPGVANYGKFVYVWPNPFNWKGAFLTADTGGAFYQTGLQKLDFYCWQGDETRDNWGVKDVTVSNTPIES